MVNPVPFEQRVLESIDEIAKSYLDGLETQLKGSNFGAHEMNDQQFYVWFNQMLRTDPDWARALVFVEGGMDELHRYAKLAGS